MTEPILNESVPEPIVNESVSEPILQVVGLHKRFRSRKKTVHAVDGVDLVVHRGETVGIVGESGSGKSTIGRCILGLEPPSEGSVVFDATDLTAQGHYRSRRSSGAKLQVVFQDPYSSLNPFRTIGETLTEPYLQAVTRNEKVALARAREVLVQVGLPEEAVDRYPSQFSGGQRQRIGIARALMLDPSLIICDEAVSALDLSTQAQVLNLLSSLARERGIAYLFIAHDLDVVQYIADRTVVLYRGRIMEQGPAGDVHDEPLHPYTVALLLAAPLTDPVRQRERRAARRALEAPVAPPVAAGDAAVEVETVVATGHAGCPFAARCAFAEDICRTARPADSAVGDRRVACHLYDAGSGHSRAGLGLPADVRETAVAVA
jgi:peptide/nickel transport system ATP-binding protein